MITTIFLSLLGGTCLLLYGLQLSGQGLQGVAGTRLRTIINAVTQHRFLGVGAGAVVTTLFQSSSATTVMLVGFASAGLITLDQTIALILGADIGTTLTVQLLAFQIFSGSLLLIGIGFLLSFLGKQPGTKSLGQAILGFGMIFLALKILTDGTEPLKTSELARQLLSGFAEEPVWGMVFAAIFTAMTTSSTATIGIALAFGHQGLLPLSGAIPIILGANIGTCATALISSLGAKAEAKRVAWAHTLFKVIGVLLIYPFLKPFEALVVHTAQDPLRQIANAHTLFNLGIAILFLPFASPLARLVTRMIPEKPMGEDPSQPKYLDPHVLDSPSLALGQATREALRMSDIVQEMLIETIRVFKENNQSLLEGIEKSENWVDQLNRQIKLYLTKLSEHVLTAEQSQREFALLTMINDLENIGDIIDKNLLDLARKKIYKGLRFSDKGLEEIVELHQLVLKNFQLVISAFTAQDVTLAQQVIKEKIAIHQKEREFKQAHIHRLHQGLPETIETSAIHLDVLTSLKRINSHVTGMAYPIVEAK
ncbi:MAG TPA: Na/Pi cotransporter family protein [Nitrospiria bacterium]|nr:Na/Pi cotransporter family protein [Nitrospiria bacterium]